jgi:hypothetical protein
MGIRQFHRFPSYFAIIPSPKMGKFRVDQTHVRQLSLQPLEMDMFYFRSATLAAIVSFVLFSGTFMLFNK